MGICDSEILRAEKFGSRDYDIRIAGQCAKCGNLVTNEDSEGCRDGYGHLFCSRECFEGYYGLGYIEEMV